VTSTPVEGMRPIQPSRVGMRVARTCRVGTLR
jgi:hypothetical protein